LCLFSFSEIIKLVVLSKLFVEFVGLLKLEGLFDADPAEDVDEGEDYSSVEELG
jgi:hypothetical protein